MAPMVTNPKTVRASQQQLFEEKVHIQNNNIITDDNYYYYYTQKQRVSTINKMHFFKLRRS